MDKNAIPSPTVSPESKPPSQRQKKLDRLTSATENAKAMMRLYPDYGKATDEYLAGIVAIFAEYPEQVQRAIAHFRDGIPGRLPYLPTIAEIISFAKEFQQNQKLVEIFRDQNPTLWDAERRRLITAGGDPKFMDMRGRQGLSWTVEADA